MSRKNPDKKEKTMTTNKSILYKNLVEQPSMRQDILQHVSNQTSSMVLREGT